MQKFIRFGKIPDNEKSVRWQKLSRDENYDIHYFLNHGDTLEQAIKRAKIKDIDIFEKGVSAFYCKNGFPQIDNLKQLTSLNSRIDEEIYIFDGDIVGYGLDNEPLVKNIHNVEKINIESFTEYIEKILQSKYTEVKNEAYIDSLEIIATDAFTSISGEKVPESVVYNGKEYFKPIETWNTNRSYYAYIGK